jgi:hypothetical protein
MMRIIAIAAVLGGIVLIGASQQGVAPWSFSRSGEGARQLRRELGLAPVLTAGS